MCSFPFSCIVDEICLDIWLLWGTTPHVGICKRSDFTEATNAMMSGVRQCIGVVFLVTQNVLTPDQLGIFIGLVLLENDCGQVLECGRGLLREGWSNFQWLPPVSPISGLDNLCLREKCVQIAHEQFVSPFFHLPCLSWVLHPLLWSFSNWPLTATPLL